MNKEIEDAYDSYHGQQTCTDIDNDILTDIIGAAGSKIIFTSNYQRCSHHERAISISASSPPNYTGEHFYFLSPSWNMIALYKNGILSEEEYSKRYLYLLQHHRKLDAQTIYDAIPNGAILLCYEPPNEFCHRRVLAEWLERKLKVKIPEWVSQEETDKAAVVDSLLNF
jgi:uncharacterized protein (DUF488 family)